MFLSSAFIGVEICSKLFSSGKKGELSLRNFIGLPNYVDDGKTGITPHDDCCGITLQFQQGFFRSFKWNVRWILPTTPPTTTYALQICVKSSMTIFLLK